MPLATFPYKAKIDQREMTWAYVRLGFEAKIDEKMSWSSTQGQRKMIYHSPESFYLSTSFLSFTYVPFYLAPYIFIFQVIVFIFALT